METTQSIETQSPQSQTDPALLFAWQRYCEFDQISREQKKSFTRLSSRIIWIGVLVVCLSVISTQIPLTGIFTIDWLFDKLTSLPVSIAGVPIITVVAILMSIGIASYTFYNYVRRDYLYYAASIALAIFGIALPFTDFVDTISFSAFFDTIGNSLIPGVAEISLLRVVLFLLPLLIAGMIEYADRFPTDDWLLYRAAAERIRSVIYLYRLQCGDFKISESEADQVGISSDYLRKDKLYQQVQSIVNDVLQKTNFRPFSEDWAKYNTESGKYDEDAGVFEKINEISILSDDDGFNQLTLEQYIQERLVLIGSWYRHSSKRSDKSVRNIFLIVQVVTILGAVLSFFGLEAWIALTTSVAVAISSIAQMRYSNDSQTLFHFTGLKLDQHRRNWRMRQQLKAHPITDDDINEFVVTTENIFKDELDMWLLLAQKQQAQSNQIIRSDRSTDSDQTQNLIDGFMKNTATTTVPDELVTKLDVLSFTGKHDDNRNDETVDTSDTEQSNVAG